MDTQKASSNLWRSANRKTSAQHGLGAPADAFSEVIPIHKLIETINSDPAALSQLARRSSELTDAQRVAVLTAFKPSKARKAAHKPKAAKVESKPKAKPVARSFLSGLSAARLGFGKGAPS